MKALVKNVTADAKADFPVAVGVVAGTVGTGMATAALRRLGPFSAPGSLLYAYGAPALAAAAMLVASSVARTKATKGGLVHAGLRGVSYGAIGAAVASAGAQLGVPGLTAGAGTAGVGVLVAEETAALSAIVAEAGTNGAALAALSDGTLAEIIADEPDSSMNGLGNNLVSSGGVADGEEDDESDFAGFGATPRVSSGGWGGGF